MAGRRVTACVLCIVLYVAAAAARSVINPDRWTYVGCYNDDRPRDLTSYHKDVSHFTGMDLERCYQFCSGFHTTYMALQNGNECRCDNGYGRYGKASESGCDEECTRDSSQICGGGWENSIYQIRDVPATAVTANMMKLKSDNTKLTFTALGDWGKDGSKQRAVAKGLGKWSAENNAAFTAAIGDNFYESGVSSADSSRFKTTWENIYTHQSLSKPWLVIEGNHDYLLGNAPYQVLYGEKNDRWVMPSLYYSMNYTVDKQVVQLFFLDTDPIRHDEDQHQIKWLRNELAKSVADWIIVLGHHPVFSSGSHGSESSTRTMYEDVRGEMVKNNVALYICGHDHLLQHIQDSTAVVDYVISGSGSKISSGEKSYAVDNIKKRKATSKFMLFESGFVGVTIERNEAKVSYLNAEGEELYSFTKENPRSESSDPFGR